MNVDTKELKKILALELQQAGIDLNVDQLVRNNNSVLRGNWKTTRRYAPTLRRVKNGTRYEYALEDIRKYIDTLIDYYSGKFKQKQQPIPTVEKMHGISLDDVLCSFDDGFQTIEIAESMTLFTGNMFGVPTNVVVLNGIAYYLTDGLNDNEKQNEK